MATPLACLLCTLDPQVTSMLVPMAQATVIAVPILFRENIAAAIRRARQGRDDAVAPESGEPGDASASEPADGSEPPGGVHP